MRKWREIHYFTLYISLFSLYFLPLYPFPILKNCLILSQKTYHTRYEKIILGRIRCEKAPQVVRACLMVFCVRLSICQITMQHKEKGCQQEEILRIYYYMHIHAHARFLIITLPIWVKKDIFQPKVSNYNVASS